MKYKTIKCVMLNILICLMSASYGFSKEDAKPFVRGGQFKDLILSMPIINGLESEGIWGNEKVLPRDIDNGIEDNQWCYWGGNPIKGDDGKYHIAICRWPENTGHHGWFESEVAHCASDNPFGPYQITQTIVKKGHNPEVLRMPDGTYALHIMNGVVFTADRMPGPWKQLGALKIESRGFRPSNRVGSNLTTEFRPDGSIILMKKDGDTAISKSGILGPYKMVSIRNYARATGYPEYPVIWRSRHQYHTIYNHAQDRKSAYMRSLDGIHWKNEEGLPYDASTTFYTDGTKNEWYKFERPKVIQDELGRATHLSLAIMDVAKGQDKGNDNHSSKNLIMPLVVERLISIIDSPPITEKTKSIALKIEAEDGFDPQNDLDIASLRLGSDSVVNYGGGCKAIRFEPDGKDMIVYFEGNNGINYRDYDFKLLGQAKNGELIFGYALLPGKSTTAPALITLPIKIEEVDGKKLLSSSIENWGLDDSKPVKAVVIEYCQESARIIADIQIPTIKPYGNRNIEIPLNKTDITHDEYEIQLIGDDHYEEYWRKVDDSDKSVAFKGNWKLHPTPNDQCFMGNQRISADIGDSVSFTFNGTRVIVYGRIGKQMGAYDVYIDGQYIEKVRCNWGQKKQEKIYQTGLLTEGKHTIELKKSKAEYNGEVTIDAFAYESYMQ